MTVPATSPVLSMQGITKRFFGTTVLDDVSLTCHSGEVHAIVGANGAGKSTLMKVLGGVYPPDGGQLVLDGQIVRFRDPHQALAHGISIIYQELTLLPERSVADNILLGREPLRRLAIDRKAMHAQARSLLAELDAAQIPTRRLVRRLTVAQRQAVEIAKGLSYRPRILVMDEPTAALPPADVAVLFRRVRQLIARGLAVLYISHRLDEVFQLADRVTVLKDGRHVATVEVDGRRRRIRSPRAAIRAGIGYVSADRKTEGLVMPLPAVDNVLLAVRALGRGPTQEAGRTLPRLAQQVGLATGLLRRESRVLSGGNQQKVVLMKWLATRAGIYLFDEPTRGVDVGAKAGIHELMRELAAAASEEAIMLLATGQLGTDPGAGARA